MALHGIKVVVNRTGLSAHVIRVWEKRYNAVVPHRTDTNRRMYSDEDIDRLQALVVLTKAGYSIGQIASLSSEEIKKLSSSANKITHISPVSSSKPPSYVPACMEAVKSMDQSRLEEVLDEAMLDVGYSGLIEKVIIPMIQQVGTDWHAGNITTADEHAATIFIKEYLSHRVKSYAPEPSAPTVLVTTPAGQMHELGAFLSSCLAKKNGWQVTYLGPSLPADAIAGAAIRSKAKVVILSVVYPIDDERIPGELFRLRQQLPEDVEIIVGGDGIFTYESALKKINATIVKTIPDTVDALIASRRRHAFQKNEQVSRSQ